MRIGRPLAFLKTTFPSRTFFSHRSLLPEPDSYQDKLPRNSLLVAQTKGILLIPTLQLSSYELDQCLRKVIQRMNEIQTICLPQENLQGKEIFFRDLFHIIQNSGRRLDRIEVTWERTGMKEKWYVRNKILTSFDINHIAEAMVTCNEDLSDIHLDS